MSIEPLSSRPVRMSASLGDVSAASDAALIEALRDCDGAAAAELFRRHQPGALRYAHAMFGPTEADDLVSDAFISTFRAIEQGGGPTSSFSSYVQTAVRNNHVSRHRRDGRTLPVEDVSVMSDALVVDDGAQDRAESAVMREAFATLPERWQQVLWHSEVDGEPLAEVAERLKMSANAVAQLNHRAREGLRRAYLRRHVAVGVSPECVEWADSIPAYVRDKLSKKDLVAFEAHLADCDDCRCAVAHVRGINRNLAALLIPALAGPGVLETLPFAPLGPTLPVMTTGKPIGVPAGRGARVGRRVSQMSHGSRAAVVAGAACLVAAAVAAYLVSGAGTNSPNLAALEVSAGASAPSAPPSARTGSALPTPAPTATPVATELAASTVVADADSDAGVTPVVRKQTRVADPTPSDAPVPRVEQKATGSQVPESRMASVVPSAPRVLFAEGFEAAAGSTPIGLADYQAAFGGYWADAAWLRACNGDVLSWAAPQPDVALSACNLKSNPENFYAYATVRELAHVLGQIGGTDPESNHVVGAMTDGADTGSGSVEIATISTIDLIPSTTARFLSVGLDAAAVNCAVSGPNYALDLIDQTGAAHELGATAKVCSSTGTYSAPKRGSVPPMNTAKAARLTASRSVLTTTQSAGFVVRNLNGSGTGNDAAIDNVRIVDVTPSLNRTFGAPTVAAGALVRLTYHVTNSSELGAKDGFVFSEQFPGSLRVASRPSVMSSCGVAGLQITPGGRELSVTGRLGAGQAGCVVSVTVVAGAPGEIALDAETGLDVVGLVPFGNPLIRVTG